MTGCGNANNETFKGSDTIRTTLSDDNDSKSNTPVDKEEAAKGNLVFATPIEFMENNIIYDSDFNPIVSSKIKNNTKQTLVGLRHNISSSCGMIQVQKKISCLPNSTKTIQIKLFSENKKQDCEFRDDPFEEIELIFSSGEKHKITKMLYGQTHKELK